MRRNGLGAPAAAILALLTACTPPPEAPPPNYKNADHPAYGPAEYNKDRAQCRTANTHLIPGGAYSEHEEIDQKAVDSCMASRGWR